MTKFELYINSQRVELFKDESVSLTETIQDIRDISKVFTDFTKPFTLPASDTNNKIFKHYYRFNIAEGYTYDARKMVDAKIELNTIPYKEGKIRLEGVDLENSKPKAYRVTFFGNTVNLPNTLGDDEINALTWLSNFNTTYSYSEVENTIISTTGKNFTVDSTLYTAALIVPLISNTTRFYYDSTLEIPYLNTDGTVNSFLGGNLYPTNASSPGVNDVHGVYFEDLTYAIKAHLIVKAIEDQYDDITFSDDFFDLTNGPDAYKNLYVLCQRKEGRIFEDMTVFEKIIDNFETKGNLNIAVSGAAVRIFNLNPNQTVNGVWTINSQQAYPTFTAVLREGSEEVLRKEFTSGTNTQGIVSQQLTNTSQGYTLTIETQSGFIIPSVTFQGTTPNGNQLTAQTTSQIDVQNEKEFIIQNHLPNLKVINFLTGLFKMFNLTAFQKDGIIHVKTLDSFYTNGTIRDITEHVDPQTIQVDKALPYKKIKFKYEDTDSILAKQHYETQGTRWGAIGYAETGDLNSNPTEFIVEAPFDHLKYERINASNTDIQWGFMADEKNEPYFKNAVLFLGEFVQTNNDLRFLQSTSGTGAIRDINKYWMPSNTVSRDSTVSKESIHFNVELSEWTRTSAFTETLFDKYYRFYIAGIFNSAKRLTKISARLPKNFILNYTLADTVMIDQEKYKINSITTDLLTGKSQLELLNETVNDAAVVQDDTGGEGGQTGVPETNVLTLYQCDSPNATFESASTLATLNLAINTRVEDSLGNTYRVTGNNVPNTHTAKTVTSTGLTNCSTTPVVPPTYYYGITRCSDGATNLRTGQDIDTLTGVATTQQVFDTSNVKYTIRTSNALAAIPSVGNVTTPSPAQLTCSGNVTTNYYQLNPCCSGTVVIGNSSNASLSGTFIYQNQTYVVSPTSTPGSIGVDIQTLPTGTCPYYYYSLNDCSNTSTIVHYARSNCSNLSGSALTYNGTCYRVVTTTNTSGTIDLDSLSSCSPCGSAPATEYYLLRDCQTSTQVVTTTTTNDVSLTANPNVTGASRVQDNSTGRCYTVNATTTDPSLYTTQIGAITDLNVLGCPSTPCTTVEYYELEQCSTGNQNYISGQTTDQITLSTNDMVHSGSTSGPLYKVIGTTTSGTSVGTVVTSTATACPTFYELQQCYTNQGQYRSGNSITDISLSVGDRVSDSCGMPYTVVSIGVTGGGYANVGTVTDTGQTGCPSLSSNPTRYSLQRCSDQTTGYISLQQVSDVTIALNDTVTIATERYQVVGTTTSTSGPSGVVCADGGNNCIVPITPPVQPPGNIYYARFISCDDPTGLIIDVFSYSQISTWWVISEVGSFECYRWDSNHQGVQPLELNSTNFNIFSTQNTAGANCIDCNNQGPPPPPPPPPPAQTCFTINLYRATTAFDLCNETTQRSVTLDASTIQAASAVYSNTDCTALLGTAQYLTDQAGSSYWYWSGTALSGPFTPNCP